MQKEKLTVGPSDWMSVPATGRWNNAPYCWKEDFEILLKEVVTPMQVFPFFM